MEVFHQCCARLDVHKTTVVGCLRVQERWRVWREVRRWETTAELVKLGDWLRQAACTHVAMEATGVYWKPVWHVLEGKFELVLANPEHSVYYNIVRKYGRATGIEAQVNGFCVHSLRATAATNALDNKTGIAKVQEWLGHANMSTTRLY